jgi:hypothetical protein
MDVEPPPKYVNGELNSQIGIRGQDSHFGEEKLGLPPYPCFLWGAAHSVKKSIFVMHMTEYSQQTLAVAAECGTATLRVRHYRT